jgi:purine-binding chemotaxis protein CheW
VSTGQALLLPLGEDLYALPIDWVLEVVAAPILTRLVTAPPIVLGLFNLRGQIVALLDTAALLGIGTLDATAFAVVVHGPEGPAGLAVTGFPQRGVLDVPAGESDLPGTNGAYYVNRRIAVLLDPGALWTSGHVGGLGLRADLVTQAVG